MKTTTHTRCYRAAAVALLAWISGFSALADYSATVLSKNPVGYWRFSGTNQFSNPVATNYGSVGAVGNGIYVNGVTLAPSALAASTETCPTFDGFSSRVEIPYTPLLNPASALTVEAWVKPSAIDGVNNGVYRAAVRTGSVRNGGGYQIQWDAGSTTNPAVFKFTLWNTTSSLECFNTNLATSGGFTILATNGVWAHLVGTWSSVDNTERIFVNGVELTNRIFAYAPNTNAVLRIGSGDTDPSDPWGQSFDPGPICQVAVYDHALSPAQVAAHYSNGTNSVPAQSYSSLVQSDAPIGYWPLNETVPAPPVAANLGLGGSALNARYGYNSTAGIPSVQGPNYGGFETTNLAAFVTANSGSISIPPFNIATNNQISIVTWIKRSGSQMLNANIVGRRVGGGEKSAFCFLDANQLAYNWDDNANQYNFNSKLVVPDSVWTMAALVCTPSNAVIYMDYGSGLLSATNTFANTTTKAFTHDVLIGPSGPYAGRRYNGAIDELAVFTNALTYSDLMDLRTAAFASGFFVAKQPAARPVMLGGAAPLSMIAAAGTSYLPLTYQLQKDGTPIGAPGSSPAIVVSNVQAADLSSTFTIVATGTGMSVTSSPASLVRWTLPGTYSGVVESYHPDAYYRFSETTPGTIYELAHGLDGFTNAAVSPTAGPNATDGANFGIEAGNNAYNFNGNAASGGGYVVASGSGILFPTPGVTKTTIALWIYPTASQTAFSGIYYSRNTDYAGLNFGPSGGYELGVSWNGNYNTHSQVFAYPNTWNFVAMVVTNDSATFYCYSPANGWQSNTIAGAFPPRNLTGGTGTSIGTDPNTALNRGIKGALDEVAVFSQILSWDDIQRLAYAGTTVNLAIEPAVGNNCQVGWSYGTLQWATDILGPWSPVPAATAPSYTADKTTASQRFFKVVP